MDAQKMDGLQRLLEFLDTLDVSDIAYRIERQAPDELMVTFARTGVPPDHIAGLSAYQQQRLRIVR